MRRWLALLALIAACKGTTATCKNGTLFVTLHFDAASAAADSVQVSALVDGVSHSTTVSHRPGMSDGTIEVDFKSGYPAGKDITLTVTAMSGTDVVGSGSKQLTPGGGCQAFELSVSGTAPDMSMPTDFASPESPDAGPQKCTSPGDCSNCVDGYCCNTICDGQCEACDVTGHEGVCTTVPSGQPHGTRAPCAGMGTVCGGNCSGASTTSCSYPTNSTSCRDVSCAAGLVTPAAACDGVGSCPSPAPVTCTPLLCNSGNTACNSMCTDDGQCPSPNPFCDSAASGACTPKKPNAHGCGGDGECTSGFCSDSVCCDQRCNGACESCSASPGHCQARPAASQPAAGHGTCTDDGSGCGGSCDGVESSVDRASCTYPTSQCRAQICTNGVVTLSAQCSQGTCPPEDTGDCGSYPCAGDGINCKTTCASDSECNNNNPSVYCDSSQHCHNAGNPGSTCAASNCYQAGCRQCFGGNCKGTTCLCPSPPPFGGALFVDSFYGTDSGAGGVVGSGPFACAFHTLNTAIANSGAISGGAINLAAGSSFSSATGNTFPLTLSGKEQILCGSGATIEGNGPDGFGGNSTIRFQGSSNAVVGCNLIGDPGSSNVILVSANGAAAPPAVPSPAASAHLIKNNTLSGSPRDVLLVGGNVEITGNHFKDTGIGLQSNITAATNNTVLANNNTFDSTGGNFDIYCAPSPQPNFTGTGNVITGTSNQVVCSGCTHCSFH